MRRRRPDRFDKLERAASNIWIVFAVALLVLVVIFQEWTTLGMIVLVVAAVATYEYVRAKRRGERWP